MDPATFIDPCLTKPDLLVLKSLLRDIERTRVPTSNGHANGNGSKSPEYLNGPFKRSLGSAEQIANDALDVDNLTIQELKSLNNHRDPSFEPTVFMFWDFENLNSVVRAILSPYFGWAQKVVRHPTDIVMLNHLILYFSTSIPSAVYLYYDFTWMHALLHWLMQSWYVGTYTLMKHQHIHMHGVLARRFPYNVVDLAFPYITDPLFGHTWNSYYYHHVKHHHVEGNGPDDLSSTIRYQRDSPLHFAHYMARFFFLVWFELPLYFYRKRRSVQALKAASWELLNLSTIVLLARFRFRPTLFVFILPLLVSRFGLMVGNWGQHAFVDEKEPDSDFRSSITLIDVASNRFCFNDGYHTSHHLNPLRHWRDHPVSFMEQKRRYIQEHALVFRNIDYIMITVRLLMKDYDYLAKCLVPTGEQINMTMKERAELLRTKTRRFTEEEIKLKFTKGT